MRWLGLTLFTSRSTAVLAGLSPPTIKRVTLVRHGEAVHNPRAEARRAAGCSFQEFLDTMKEDDVLDAPLTSKGLDQVQASRASLDATLTPEVVLVSPLSRAIDTAQIIFPGANWIALDDLRERSGWMLNCKRRSRCELEALYPDIDFRTGLPTEHDELWTEEIEEWASTSARGYAALEYAWARPERTIAIVCHGGLLDAILCMCKNVVADEVLRRRFKNAECRTALLDRREDGVFRLRVDSY